MPLTVYSSADGHGFIPTAIGIAREKGFSAYVGVDDEGVPFRAIAEIIGRHLGVPVSDQAARGSVSNAAGQNATNSAGARAFPGATVG